MFNYLANFSWIEHSANGLVHVVGADFGERSCPKDVELRNENPQLAYHQAPPCNMYCVGGSLF